MSQQEVTEETWKALYAAAAQFQSLRCWEWMQDSDVFGVQNPADGEIGYCCIMGFLQEHFALAVYQGTEGLNGLIDMGLRELPMDPLTALVTQKCLMASFEDRAQLQARDLQKIKELGLKFRGRNAWPLFRSYRPGYAPWYLTQDEAVFLTLALEQAGTVALAYRDRPGFLASQNALYDYERFLVRAPHPKGGKKDGKLEWADAWLAPAPYESTVVLPPPPDRERVQRIADTAARTDGVLDIAYFFAPTGIRGEDGERPWYPYLVLAVDDASGMPLHTDLVKHSELGTQLGELFLSLVEKMEQLPETVQVCQEQAQILLEPVLAALEIELVLKDELPAVQAVQEAFLNYMS